MDGTQALTHELQEIDSVVKKYKGNHGELLSILEETQRLNARRYLSEDALNHISIRMGIPLSRIYNVVTFYSFFNLKPQGKHTVSVCRGTACHTRGSKTLLDHLGMLLDSGKHTNDGETSFTTLDNRFTVSTVACFGQCALAPVAEVDGTIHSNVTTGRLQRLVRKISKERKKS